MTSKIIETNKRKTTEDVEVPIRPKIKMVHEGYDPFRAMFSPKKDVFAENANKVFWAQLIVAAFIFGLGITVGLLLSCGMGL